ncbi:hypothetical protein MMC25_000797 [Agyrium rufum]|nr:hypothetical protein [Agyrium rufum]
MVRTTEQYARYDESIHNATTIPLVPFADAHDMTKTAHYPLYMTHQPLVSLFPEYIRLPPLFVRLDDFSLFRILSELPIEIATKMWPAEFDKDGSIRKLRPPVGYAAKVWATIGNTDALGRTIDSPDEEGYYYTFYKGYCLMGKEGCTAGFWRKMELWRTSNNVAVGEITGWLKDFKCVFQLPSGDPRDITFREDFQLFKHFLDEIPRKSLSLKGEFYTTKFSKPVDPAISETPDLIDLEDEDDADKIVNGAIAVRSPGRLTPYSLNEFSFSEAMEVIALDYSPLISLTTQENMPPPPYSSLSPSLKSANGVKKRLAKLNDSRWAC